MTAHVTFHFALGMTVGTILAAVHVTIARRRQLPWSRLFLYWLAWSYGIGLFAITPSLFRHLGVPEVVCRHAVMNIFVLHPAIDRWRPDGQAIGTAGVAGMAAVQYALLVLAVAMRRRQRGR